MWIFSVNPSAMPAEFDINLAPTISERESYGPGIYELDDDLLRICTGIVGEFDPESRPDRFESSEDYPTRLWVFRRVTEEDDE